ncbi:BMP family lipoprotein [Paenibacillus xylaniclasticus]|uniref:BMP family lipoprotein n=1 Tax=Paenibacillus xylaniclasticus TaxID=588083 RepID=UPI000FD751D2|nr:MULTISPECIES: BMP family ABC transporter substrate-binding protein [Paenibacillus]GFN33800.1 BMP family ABC transporter substrate-binding protein [Paenibacillus curdlanolyticus]
MNKKLVLMIVAVMLVVIALAGCGSEKKEPDKAAAPESSNTAAGTAAGSNPAGSKGTELKIGMATDGGGVNDKSFNQSAWEGLQRLAEETGVSVKYLESKTDSDYIPNLNTFVKNGYTLTWGIGFLFVDAMKTIAEQNPDAKLAIIDNVVEAPNVESVTFAENEGSFLVGVVAGLMTKSNKIGFVGGMEIPVIKKFEAGFSAGVAAVNPDAKVLINYVGDFNKPDIGKQQAATMYNDGADIIFQAAGASGNGVFTEALDRFQSGNQVWVIGVDKDQSLEFGDDVTLTSMMKGVEAAVLKVSKDVLDGKFEGGTTVELGLKDNGVGLPAKNKNVPDVVLAKVEEFKGKIISGEIVVPKEPAAK